MEEYLSEWEAFETRIPNGTAIRTGGFRPSCAKISWKSRSVVGQAEKDRLMTEGKQGAFLPCENSIFVKGRVGKNSRTSSLKIPRASLVVLTGLSVRKSSLAFVQSYGGARVMWSLFSYARQF
jgi:hypothetical protein